VIEAVQEAFRRHDPPTEVTSDRHPVFTSVVSQALLGGWGVRERFGKLGEPRSVAVTERIILTPGGAVPNAVHAGQQWQRPERSAKALPLRMERRHFAEVRVTAFRLAA
jgi:hypothetical protein